MNIAELDLASIARFGEYTRLHCEGRSFTNTEFQRRSGSLARVLRDRGVQPGDRVLIVMRNAPETMGALQAVWMLGGVAAPVNFQSTMSELRCLMEDSGARLVLTSPGMALAVREAARGVAETVSVLTFGPTLVPEAVDIVPEIYTAVPLETIVERAPDDTALLLYTPGTAGRPKGVMLTHRNLLASVDSYVRISPRMERCTMLHNLPLSHAYGLLMAQLASVWGCTVVLQPAFSPVRVLQAIQEHRVERMPVVPAMMAALTHHQQRGQYQTSSLAWVVSGGAALPERLRQDFEEAFHCRVYQGYGLPETAAVAFGYGDEDPYRPGSVGRVMPGAQARILGPSELPPRAGRAGEICLRGDMITAGYWNDPGATREAFVNGWFRTGEVGFLDGEGYCYITDRKKDLIFRGAEHISPREIEKVLQEHPAVAEAAVVGMPDPVFGENVCAVVVLKEGAQATEEEIRRHAASRLPRFKVPARVMLEAAARLQKARGAAI